MDLPLTDEQAGLLLAELDRIIDDDRYPLSARIRALREIRALLKPYPERLPLPPPPRQYEPPSLGRYKKWSTSPTPSPISVRLKNRWSMYGSPIQSRPDASRCMTRDLLSPFGRSAV